MTDMYTEDALHGFMDAVSADHARMTAALEDRLQLAQQCREHWRTGTVDAILDVDGANQPREGMRRGSVQQLKGVVSVRGATWHSLLSRLANESSPLPPQALVKLLPIAKQVAEVAEREDEERKRDASMSMQYHKLALSWAEETSSRVLFKGFFSLHAFCNGAMI
eukprot:2714486-Amphidinium_carterae.2